MSVRDLLLKPVVMPQEVVLLPELGEGVSITVRGLNAKEKGAFEMQFVRKGEADIQKQRQMRERMIVACAVDDSGGRLFTVDDVSQLGLQSVSILDRIFEACQRINGSQNVESAEKN